VARRGYRFLAPVNGAAVSVAAPSQSVSGSKHWRIPVLAALLLAGMGLAWVVANWPHSPPRSSSGERRLTANAQDNPVLGSVNFD